MKEDTFIKDVCDFYSKYIGMKEALKDVMAMLREVQTTFGVTDLIGKRLYERDNVVNFTPIPYETALKIPGIFYKRFRLILGEHGVEDDYINSAWPGDEPSPGGESKMESVK